MQLFKKEEVLYMLISKHLQEIWILDKITVYTGSTLFMKTVTIKHKFLYRSINKKNELDVYSCPLNNMGLNGMGPLVHRVFYRTPL